ncbi:MAG TPA: hypothetical protein VJS69_12885, partial [Candidatus Krumholzibacteria bacterium]|nr:hypothetical protein [Candidatus Krumholzibacteria bacterium]
ASSLYLAADANGYQCVLSDPGPSSPFVTIYAFINSETSATAVAFSLSVPAASGLYFLGDSSPYTVTGSSPTGALIQFGSCLTSQVMVMEMRYLRISSPTPCTRIVPGPHPQLGAYRIDCSLSEAPFEYAGLLYAGTEGCAGPIPATNPTPSNGSSDVSLTPSLSWDDAVQVCTGVLSTAGDPTPGTSAYLYFGTSPNPPDFGTVTKPHTVGPLQPGKKYYWRVENSATWPYVSSATWSFTTTSEVATRPTTWGAIKALYR